MKQVRRSGGCACVLALAAAVVPMTGCKSSAVPDATVTTAVQAKLQGDSAISAEPVQVSTTAGTVTLTGQVSNAAARSLAANDAAGVTGVQKVVNDLTVADAANAPGNATSYVPQSSLPQSTPTPKAPVIQRVPQREISGQRQGYSERQVYPSQAAAAPAPIQRPLPPPPPAPVAAAPAFHAVTVPAGSVLSVRITQSLDSESAHAGDSFSGALASDLVQDGVIVLPRGSAVSGTVVDAKDAAHFKGSALLSLQLNTVARRGQQIPIATTSYVREGEGRGKNTAVKTGVGAAAGAVLGGIFGGGKGAAIGAAAGGGTGAGINAITRGQQVQIPSESTLSFTTTNPFTVRVSNSPDGNGGNGLQNRYQ